MELLATWWASPLAEDHYIWLRQKEVNSLPPYRSQSPQLKARLYIVDWLAVICDESQVCLTARHLAMLLLDYFMDNHHVDRSQLKLVALCSLHIAAKFEECETNIPKVSDLNRLADNPGYSAKEFLETELRMLKFFGWNVNLPTAAHFCDYYLVKSIDRDDCYNGHYLGDDNDLAAQSMSKYVVYFLEVSLQDYLYRNCLPSLVCAACVASARFCFKITPYWPTRLQERTGYSWMEVQPLVEHMMRAHERDEKRRRSESPVSDAKDKSTRSDLMESRSPVPLVCFVSSASAYCGVPHSSFFLSPMETKVVLQDGYSL